MHTDDTYRQRLAAGGDVLAGSRILARIREIHEAHNFQLAYSADDYARHGVQVQPPILAHIGEPRAA